MPIATIIEAIGKGLTAQLDHETSELGGRELTKNVWEIFFGGEIAF